MSLTFYHIDSFQQIYNDDPTHSTFQFVNGSRAYNRNAFNIKIRLPSPIIGFKKMFLKSFECPILFPNVRASSRLNFINVVCTGSTKSIVLADKNYSGISSLITDLNTASTSQYGSDNIVFSLDTITGFVKINSITHTSINVSYSNLGYILGFRVGLDDLTSNNVVAEYSFNLGFDSYINMYITNISLTNNRNSNRTNSTFKIPITTYTGAIQYSSENTLYSQSATISDPQNPIYEMNVVFIDRFGLSLNSWGGDWSCSLAFSTD